MKTNHTFYIIITSLLIACSPKVYDTVTYVNPKTVEIDGDSNDWADTLKLDAESKILYNYAHDNKNLYVRLKIFDNITKQKIILKGFTIWIDTLNKTSKFFGIRYPMEKNDPSISGIIGNPASFSKSDFNDQFSTGIEILEVLSYEDDINPTMQYSKKENDIHAAIKLDSLNFMVYEAKIPLFKLYGNSYVNRDLCFSIGCETGYFIIENDNTQDDFDYGNTATTYETHRQDNRSINPLQPVDNNYTQTGNHKLMPMNKATSFWVKNICIKNSQ